jgi:arylsulfatase A-like enzyme
MGRFLRWTLGVAVVVAIVLFALRGTLMQHLPGIIGRLSDPIGEAQAVTWGANPAWPADWARPPNIVVILADDLGFNDITLDGGVATGDGGPLVPTPNIDSIATAGVRFRNGYTGNATCAPSRAAIMTGRYATRFGFEFTPAPKAFSRLIASFNYQTRKPIYHPELEDQVPDLAKLAVPPSEITLAELLKTKGYRTLMLGKWHLGEAPGTRPTGQGFDDFVGFWSGAQMYGDPDDPAIVNSKQDFDPIDVFLWSNLTFAVRKDAGPRFAPGAYMTDYLADEAVRAIDANKGNPFFLYVAFNAPHTPLQATKADYDALAGITDHRLRVYGAMIRALDRGVGKVLGAVHDHGLDDDTLVIFTSDNGGADYIGLPDINKPYRGWKATFFEGGIHAPFFMRWPARIPAGSTYAAPVAHIDIFATAAAAANAPLPTDRVIRRGAVRTRRSERRTAQIAVLALRRLPHADRRRLQTASRTAAEQEMAVRLARRSHRTAQPRRGAPRSSRRARDVARRTRRRDGAAAVAVAHRRPVLRRPSAQRAGRTGR